jgi:hypothetical protein
VKLRREDQVSEFPGLRFRLYVEGDLVAESVCKTKEEAADAGTRHSTLVEEAIAGGQKYLAELKDLDPSTSERDAYIRFGTDSAGIDPIEVDPSDLEAHAAEHIVRKW